jgi:hypothetical protein
MHTDTETPEKPSRYENSRFDHVKFGVDLEAIRKFYRLENSNQLAKAIGVHREVVTRLTTGEGVAFDALCKVIQFCNLDLRDYIAPIASVGELAPCNGEAKPHLTD